MSVLSPIGKRLYADSELAVGWVTHKNQPSQLSATLISKATFSLRHDAAALLSVESDPLSGDKYQADDPLRGLLYTSDFAPFKPNADVIVNGSCHCPEAKPLPAINVAVRVGELRKSLYVVGDRVWEHRLFRKTFISEPIPFVKLPLTYERAFGGPGTKSNPIGKGRRSGQAPNIEFYGQRCLGPSDDIAPAGLGPIAANWEPRKGKIGTYKGKWQKERWPWFPEDFDWTYFNAAPADQQIQGYLRGDEELQFENLHPEHPLFKSRLPGLRMRCFLNERLQSGEFLFREVRMNLDTLWINLDEEKLILVWRGLSPVKTLKLREIENVLAATEPLSSSPRSLEDYRAEFMQRLNGGKSVALPKTDPVAGEMKKKLAVAKQEMAKMKAAADKAFAEQKAQLIAQGVDPKRLEEPTKPQTLAEAKAEYLAAMVKLKESHPEMAAPMAESDFNEFEQMEARMAANNPPPKTRESVQAALAEGKHGARKDLSNQELSGLDLSEMDFSKADLSGADLSKCKLFKANLTGADFTGANLSRADLTEANLTGATLDEVDLSKAILVNTKLAGMTVAGTNFSGLELTGANFSGCHGKGADFSKANLTGSRFTGAKLPRSNFSGASLEKADFNSAELPAAQFDGAQAKGVQMVKADISSLRGGDQADFSRGNFRGATGAGSIWEKSMLDGADFSSALLTRANFSEASLREARFDRADAMKASFDDACLQRASLTNANLLRATFDRADLTQTNLMKSNLYGAGFWEAVFQRTIIDGANVKATQIAR